MKHEWTFRVKEVVGNYDGDTISVVLDLGFKTYAEHNVRLHAVDTPERQRRQRLYPGSGRDLVEDGCARYASREVRQADGRLPSGTV